MRRDRFHDRFENIVFSGVTACGRRTFVRQQDRLIASTAGAPASAGAVGAAEDDDIPHLVSI
jgi:hypothetical protein